MLAKLVMGVVGVVVLSSVFEIIMPDGAFKKYVKMGVSAVFVLVVLSSVDFAGIRETNFFTGEQIELNTEVLDKVETMKWRELASRTEQRLASAGFEGTKVSILHDSEGNVSEVRINLSNLVLTSESANINITMEVRRTAAEFLGLSISKVKSDEYQRQ